jgi:hypothetical protein
MGLEGVNMLIYYIDEGAEIHQWDGFVMLFGVARPAISFKS